MDKEILLLLCLIWSPNFRKIVKIEHLPLRAAILVSNVPRRRAPFFSRRNRAKTAKKCAKKCDARATFLFCLLNLFFFFFDVLVAVASSDLTVPIVSSLSSCETL